MAAASALTTGLVRAPTAPPGAGRAEAAVGWQQVDLSGYRFGSFGGDSSVLARAAASQVGFVQGEEGASYGPWSFERAPNGAVRVLDQVNNRILIWRKGSGSTPERVALPFRAPEDFAVAADGRLYVDVKPAPPDPRQLVAISPSGSVLWSVPQTREEQFNTQLRIGPDGRLYKVGTFGWRQLTTASGAPLSSAQQLAGSSATQPLAGGLRLAVTFPSGRAQIVLTDATGAVVRRWRVTTTAPAELGPARGTADLIGSDLAVPIEVFGRIGGTVRWETLTLRLSTVSGVLTGRVAMDRHAFWGDEVTQVRIGPDGAVDELRSSPETGVSVVRHSWARSATAGPTTTAPSRPSNPSSSPGSASPSVVPTSSSVPGPSPSASTGQQAGGSTGRNWVPITLGIAAALAAAGAAWSWRDHRR